MDNELTSETAANGLPGSQIPDPFSFFVKFLTKVFKGDLSFTSTEGFQNFAHIYKFVATYVSLALILGILYVLFRGMELGLKDKKLQVKSVSHSAKKENPKWKKVTEHIETENPSDWRLAILEADIMLGEMLESMGYHGETIGDKLKQIEKSDFLTLDSAWEAHKIRNLIAHEGSKFTLSRRESRRVIGLYRDIFREFRMI